MLGVLPLRKLLPQAARVAQYFSKAESLYIPQRVRSMRRVASRSDGVEAVTVRNAAVSTSCSYESEAMEWPASDAIPVQE